MEIVVSTVLQVCENHVCCEERVQNRRRCEIAVPEGKDVPLVVQEVDFGNSISLLSLIVSGGIAVVINSVSEEDFAEGHFAQAIYWDSMAVSLLAVNYFV